VSFLAAVLTEIYLCNVCSCPEILRRNGRGQVAHSLGARMAVHACSKLPPESRPQELHLIAAAMPTSEASPLLARLVRPTGCTHVYFTQDDLALAVAFRAVDAGGSAALGEISMSL
jgi:hypothetical protein